MGKLNWQSMNQLALIQKLRLSFNYAYGLSKIPNHVYEIYNPGISRTRQQRHSLQMKCLTPTARTEAFLRAGFKCIADEWNALPQATVNLSKTQFKATTSQSTNLTQTLPTTTSRALRSHRLS